MLRATNFFTKPWLYLPAEVSHSLSLFFIRSFGTIYSFDGFFGHSLDSTNSTQHSWQPLVWRGLHFRNRLGTSGGLDKNAEGIKGWWALGAGFVEVGTVTPKPQTANPGQILKRDREQQALWNKMGFPNKGVEVCKKNLQKLPRPYSAPIFVNIGKNRETTNENAVKDYLYCIHELRNEADAFIINVSSPNTPGLRELLSPPKLRELLTPLVAECQKNPPRPILLKLSPDLTDDIFKEILDVSLSVGVDGWILTNTTTDREKTPQFPIEGGVSGQPLANKATHLLKLAHTHLGVRKEDRLLISVGGILNTKDVFDRLSLGATLVQVYSAVVFDGPFFFRKVAAKAKMATVSNAYAAN